MNLDDMKFKCEMAIDRWVERWYDFRSFFVLRWWRFREWRRSRNPELVELDAYRELAGIELRLRQYPRAIPLLERAVELCEITEQDMKRKDFIERLEKSGLADAGDSHDPVPPRIRKMAEEMSGDEKALLEKARALVENGGRCSTSFLQRRLGIGYNEAARLVEVLRCEQPG